MNIDNITINTQSSIRIDLDKIIYFDPFEIKEKVNDADIIFITHDHYDHFDINSINNIKNDNTIVVAPKSIKDSINKLSFKECIFLNPDEEKIIDGIKVQTVRAYNIDKKFHLKSNSWLGYIIEYNNIKYYIAGDTDITEDNKQLKCDVAFLPCGGKFTMDYKEAAELAKIINPKVVIPIHYGSIVGTPEDGAYLKDSLKDTSIEVIEKIKF